MVLQCDKLKLSYQKLMHSWYWCIEGGFKSIQCNIVSFTFYELFRKFFIALDDLKKVHHKVVGDIVKYHHGAQIHGYTY